LASKPKPGFAAAALADAAKAAPSPDKLKALRANIARVRDLELEIQERDEVTDKLEKEKSDLLLKKLPDMFNELGIKVLELEPEGNLPGYVAKSAAYYAANIAANWDEDRRQRAFKWLRDHKLGDVIKSNFQVELGRGTEKQQKALKAALKKLKVPFAVREGVPHTTLTAIVREMIEKQGKTPPLDTLGATVGTVVQVKQAKQPTNRRSTDGK
jgi:collagenase-like PrtC family protease